MDESCRACRAGLEHCHGTLIVHPLRAAECTADGCASGDAVLHALVVNCDAAGCGCAAAVAS